METNNRPCLTRKNSIDSYYCLAPVCFKIKLVI